MSIFKKEHFKNLFEDFLFTYRQFLLNGYLHKEINSGLYNKNSYTWDTLLRSLESTAVLGLAKLLEQEYFKRGFDDLELDTIAKKIINVRTNYIAHNHCLKMRSGATFLENNKLNGSNMIIMIEALKNRFIHYEKSFKLNINVQRQFEQENIEAMTDLKKWLKYFND